MVAGNPGRARLVTRNASQRVQGSIFDLCLVSFGQAAGALAHRGGSAEGQVTWCNCMGPCHSQRQAQQARTSQLHTDGAVNVALPGQQYRGAKIDAQARVLREER